MAYTLATNTVLVRSLKNLMFCTFFFFQFCLLQPRSGKEQIFPWPVYNTWQAARVTKQDREQCHRNFKAETKQSTLTTLQKCEELQKLLTAAFLIWQVQTAALLHFCHFHKNFVFS